MKSARLVGSDQAMREHVLALKKVVAHLIIKKSTQKVEQVDFLRMASIAQTHL